MEKLAQNTRLKIAAACSMSIPLEVDLNLKRISYLLEEFERKGVEFALFPELSVSGYINSKDKLKEYTQKHFNLLQSLIKLSSTLTLAFSVGLPMPLKDGWGITQLTFYSGDIIHAHFKTHTSVHESQHFESSDTISCFDFKGFRIGIQLCLESHYPELSTIQQKKGADILCFAFASPRETPEDKYNRLSTLLQTRAYDNACFVMACNQTGKTGSGKEFAGFSLISSPRGKILNSSTGYDENFSIWEIDKSEIDKIKNSRMSNFPGYRKLVR